MTESLLFIEIGVVVTEIKGPHVCSIEPCCGPNGPTYLPSERVDVDFADCLGQATLATVKYDQVVASTGNRGSIGMSWPGGCYEGILCVRESVVDDDDHLGAAADALSASNGPRCRYQVITSIDGATTRRYHGFLAQVVAKGNTTVFKIVGLDGYAINDYTITFDPNDPNRAAKFFLGGNVVDGHNIGDSIFDDSVMPDGRGAVFMNLDELSADVPWLLAVVPKQPKDLGL